MVRLVVIAIAVVVIWLVLLSIFRSIKKANVDWTGVTTMIGFIVLAFYLRHVTGMG